MGSDRESGPQGQQDEDLARAREAAVSGDPLGMLEAIYRSSYLDGLKRAMERKWPSIPPPDVDYVVAQAVDALYAEVHKGGKVLNLTAFLWKVADRKAFDYDQMRQNERTTSPDELERIVNETEVATRPIHDAPDCEADKEVMEYEEKRTKAIALARQLLPRLGQQNIQAVMSYVIDCVEARREDVPQREIAEALGLTVDTVKTSLWRGFQRLDREARKEGITEIAVAGGFGLNGIVAETEEEEDE
jgi:DNA-directed RNA polymerase specialized sigma24 family protein